MGIRRRTLLGSLGGLAALAGCQFGGPDGPRGGTDTATLTPAPTPTDGLAVSWTTGPDVPERRTQTTAVALDGRLYVVGGIVGDVERRMAVYDPAEGQWHGATPPPKPVNHTSAVAYDGHLHVFGGYSGSFLSSDPLAAHWVYDPDTDEWSDAPPLPTPRGALVAAVAGGRVYAVGGASAGGTTDVVEAYDPDEESWSSVASLPTPREHLAAGVVDNRVYAAGGRQGLGDLFDALACYDPERDAWTERAPMPTPRWEIGAATLDDAIHTVCGGAVPSAEETRKLEILSLAE